VFLSAKATSSDASNNFFDSDPAVQLAIAIGLHKISDIDIHHNVTPANNKTKSQHATHTHVFEDAALISILLSRASDNAVCWRGSLISLIKSTCVAVVSIFVIVLVRFVMWFMCTNFHGVWKTYSSSLELASNGFSVLKSGFYVLSWRLISLS
jgi:hypothetical protein